MGVNLVFQRIALYVSTASPKVQSTFFKMREFFEQIGPSQIGLSFNGGKDSTATLFLALYTLRSVNYPHPIKCIYMKEQDPFPEIVSYIQEMQTDHSIDLHEYDNAGPISEAAMKRFLTEFIQASKVSHVIAGTRSTDPYAQGLGFLAPTDEEKLWPRFTRLLPIYDWSYAEVWDFIVKAQLPYCELYKRGFTYVGDQTNTAPNPFIHGRHAMFASDNTELFSRHKLLQSLPRVDGKIVLRESQVMVLYDKHSPADSVDFGGVAQALHHFCAQNGFVFEGDIRKADLIASEKWQLESGTAFERAILERKGQPGQFSVLYVGASVHPSTKAVTIQL